MQFNRKLFFVEARKHFIGLNQGQVDGCNAIMDALEADQVTDLRQIAYVFCTAEAEVGANLLPVREGFAKTDAEARKIAAKLISEHGLKNYAAVDPRTGFSYYGRGYPQLTWYDNYAKCGTELKIDLVGNPDLMLIPQIAARVMVRGMIKGLFTKGETLSKYFNSQVTDWPGARRIINGADRADFIATLGRLWFAIVRAEGVVSLGAWVAPAGPVPPVITGPVPPVPGTIVIMPPASGKPKAKTSETVGLATLVALLLGIIGFAINWIFRGGV